MAKLITNEQLEAVVAKLVQKLSTKASLNDNNKVVVPEGLQFSNMQITTNEYGVITILKEDTGQRVYLEVSDENDFGRILTTDGNGIVKSLNVDYIVGGTGSQGDGRRYFCFPNSTQEAKERAFGNRGGGMFLTSFNRSWTTMSETIDGEDGRRGAPDEYSPFEVIHDTYTEIVTCYPVEFILDPITPGRIDEYWIEVIVPANIFATSNTVSGHPIKFTGLDIKWANGEPDWREIGNRRVQIHIMNGIATYVSIPYDSTNNLNE